MSHYTKESLHFMDFEFTMECVTANKVTQFMHGKMLVENSKSTPIVHLFNWMTQL